MFPMTPADALRLSVKTGLLMLDAQMVIGLRLMGMAQMWRVAPFENRRMMAEKIAAASASGKAVQKAMMAGKRPAAIVDAALKPVASRARANAGRLARRGPKTP